MATWCIHFRIADEILKHLKNIDREYFIIGSIAPDCGKRVDGGYEPPTEITHLARMWNKKDCDYNYILKNCINGEQDFKKRSFFAGYYTHLITDSLFCRLVSLPIEERFGLYRENPGLSRAVKREWYDADYAFLAENSCPAFEDFKGYKKFEEAYPSIYRHGEIGIQMKNIAAFYSGKAPEGVEFYYTDKQSLDSFVDDACKIILDEMRGNSMIDLFNCVFF